MCTLWWLIYLLIFLQLLLLYLALMARVKYKTQQHKLIFDFSIELYLNLPIPIFSFHGVLGEYASKTAIYICNTYSRVHAFRF